MKLRDYQQECVDSIFREFENVHSTLIVLPTGGGKTICFADVVRRFHPKRSLVLAHRAELIFQAKEKIEMTTGLECDIEMADQAASSSLFCSTPVIVSTVQTQISGPRGKERMTRFRPDDFGLLIIDEAHHSASKSYRKIIDYYRQNTALKVLGVTATPDRSDEEALGQIFQTVAFDYEILDAIHGGYLVPVDQQFVTVHELDFSNVKTTAGDLNGGDLAALMEQERNMQEVAAASIQIIGDKRTLIFTASVKQAETLCNILNRHRNNMAGWVCGKTDKEERRKLLEQFKNGERQVVVNCAVLTEGYDNPSVEIVIMARPTKSRSLYSQMVGRGTRPLPGVIDNLETADERKAAIEASAKKSLLVVDFVGNSGKHKLMTSADILGGKVSEEAIERAKSKVKKSGQQARISDVLDQAEDEIKAEKEKRRVLEEARKARIVAQAKFSMNEVNPFDRYNVRYQEMTQWHKENQTPLSEKQRQCLRKIGADPDKISPSCGRQLLGAHFSSPASNEPSPAQIVQLRKYGYPISVTKKEASVIITKIAENGWRRPPDPPKPPEVGYTAKEIGPSYAPEIVPDYDPEVAPF